MTNLSTGTSGSASDVVVRRAVGTGPATWAMGMLFERLVRAEETAGLLGASVVTQPPGQASPLHVHTREAEAWFLLQGAMTYRAGERLIRMTAGDFIYLPREVPHAFRTTGTVPVRFLALSLPGGLLDIYDEVGVPAAERRLPDAGVSDADVARWLELAPRYGLRVVGPPIPEAEAQAGEMAAQARAACTTRAAPATTTPHALQTVAEFTPFDGLNQLVRAPQLSGSIHAAWVASAFAWLATFDGGAIWRFRNDTARI